jgi:hypothetical protein
VQYVQTLSSFLTHFAWQLGSRRTLSSNFWQFFSSQIASCTYYHYSLFGLSGNLNFLSTGDYRNGLKQVQLLLGCQFRYTRVPEFTSTHQPTMQDGMTCEQETLFHCIPVAQLKGLYVLTYISTYQSLHSFVTSDKKIWAQFTQHFTHFVNEFHENSLPWIQKLKMWITSEHWEN